MRTLGRCQSRQAARTPGLAAERVSEEDQPENPPRLAAREADLQLLPRDLERTCESEDYGTYRVPASL